MQEIGTIAAAAIILVAVVYAPTQPEPVPAERLSDAAQDAGEAAQNTFGELATAAEETAEALQEEVEATIAELQGDVTEAMDAVSAGLTAASEETQNKLKMFVPEWRDSGIVTDEGVDFDAAMASVNDADLSSETKTEINKVLAFIPDLPREARAKLEVLENSL